MSVRPNNNQKRLKLPRSRILRGRGSFDQVFEHSQRIKGRTVDVRFLFKDDAPAGILAGFVSAKRTGNAVSRNRNKRLMREAYRIHQSMLLESEKLRESALRIVFIAHKGKKTFAQVEQDIMTHLDRIRLYAIDSYRG